jgi:hypothetical protein
MGTSRILQTIERQRDWFYALALAILAAIPRLYRLDLAEFKLDEANHYRMAYLLTRGSWRWVGSTSSIGFPKPPLFIYILSVPLSISNDPRITTAFLGLLGAVAVGVFYLVARRLLGRSAAWGAGLAFALTPQAILHARKLFTADLIPPLCSLLVAAAVAYLTSKPKQARWLAASVTFAFALLFLTTFSPILLLPTVALLLLERRRDLELVHWLGAAVAFILPFAPYLLAVRERIPTAFAGSGDGSSSLDPGTLLDWLWGLSGAPRAGSVASVPALAAGLWAVLSVIGLALLVNRVRKDTDGPIARFVLSGLGLPLLLALLVPLEVQPHYLIILYPLLFVLPAAGIEFLWRRTRVLGWLALAFVALTAGWQAWEWARTLPDKAVETTSLGYWWEIAEETRSRVLQEEAAEALLLVPEDHRWNAQANSLDALLSDTPHRLVNGHTTVVYPSHASVLVIAPEVRESASITHPCTRDLGGDLYQYRLWDPERADGCTDELVAADAQWASGVRLLGYSVSGDPQPGGTIHITLHVETMQGPSDEDIRWFNHLEDQERWRCGQFDHAGWPASRWQPGERMLLYFDIEIASDAARGPFTLRVGQYVYRAPEDLQNIPVVDAAGNPVDYAVALPVPQPGY